MMPIIIGSLQHQKYCNDDKDDTDDADDTDDTNDTDDTDDTDDNDGTDDTDGDDNHWQSAALCLLSSLQLKNFPLNSWTPTTANMNCNYYNHRSGEPKSHIDFELSSCKPEKGGRRAEC